MSTGYNDDRDWNSMRAGGESECKLDVHGACPDALLTATALSAMHAALLFVEQRGYKVKPGSLLKVLVSLEVEAG